MHHKKGVVVIPTVLMLGGLIAAIALSGSLIIYLLSSSNYGLRLSNAAFSSAKAGLQDGTLRLLRNNSFISPSPGYKLTVSENSFTCVVVNDLGEVNGILSREIVSLGSAFSRYHQLKSTIKIDKNNGRLKVVSSEEQPISSALCN